MGIPLPLRAGAGGTAAPRLTCSRHVDASSPRQARTRTWQARRVILRTWERAARFLERASGRMLALPFPRPLPVIFEVASLDTRHHRLPAKPTPPQAPPFRYGRICLACTPGDAANIRSNNDRTVEPNLYAKHLSS